MWQSVVGGLFLSVIGIFMLLSPQGVWKATERWQLIKAAGDSPVFMMVLRAVGAVMTVVGLLVCFGVLK